MMTFREVEMQAKQLGNSLYQGLQTCETTAANGTRPRGEIEQVLSGVQELAAIVGKEVAGLREALDPILMQNGQVEKESEGEPKCATKLGCELQQVKMQLNSIRRAVMDLTRSVAL